MPARTLMAYATRNGSTQEVAAWIAGVMREAGVTVELMRMKEATEFGGYSTAILGAPLYLGRMLKEFHEFVELHREPLSRMKVWCFVLGPVENKPEQFAEAERQAREQLAHHEWLVPEDVRIFGGLWDVKRMEFPFKLMRWLPASKVPAMDARDWEAIGQWAEEIAVQIVAQNQHVVT
ncbi:MAG: flavodoxin [Acidobacteriota bacterium]|nr:flavodoxin [Acidobacteriota bacterium]